MRQSLHSTRSEKSAFGLNQTTRRSKTRIVAIEPLEGRRLLSVSVIGSGGISAVGITLHEQAGVAFTADLGDFVTIAPGTKLQASVAWGDGTTSPGVITVVGAVGVDQIKFEVDASHTYALPGVFAIHATVFQSSPTPTSLARLVASFNDTAIVSPSTTLLDGEITGTYTLAPTSVAVGAEYIFNGTGTAGVMGAVTVHGDIILPGPGSTGVATGTLTLTHIGTSAADGGSVTLKLTALPVANPVAFPTAFSYVITDGTGRVCRRNRQRHDRRDTRRIGRVKLV